MKLTMKLFLIISLFCSTALADGDIDQGQRNGNGSGGGFACAECVVDNEFENKDFDRSEKKRVEHSFMTFIKGFFDKMIG